MAPSGTAAIAAHLRHGDLVAVADGVGMASSDTLASLSEAAGAVGGVDLLLGWCIGPRPGLDLGAFASVRTVMGGYRLRRPLRSGPVRYVPARLGTMPALLRSTLRPDVLVLSAVRGGRGLGFGTEIGWSRAAAGVARVVLVEERTASVTASAVDLPPHTELVVVGATEDEPDVLDTAVPDDDTRRIAASVARLVPEGAAVQVGPGTLGRAVLEAIDVPVHLDSGVLIDAVVDLDRRGLLLGEPIATYLAGTAALYAWSSGRTLLHGVERTHDISRLAERPLVAANTALEIDVVGQVNVESVGGDPIAGIGGHADYALAASRSDGLSVIALPTRRGGRGTLVRQLSAATSTARSDVDVVVTERGVADLRGLSDDRREAALVDLWGWAP